MDMKKGEVDVKNLSIKFNLNPEKVDNLKEFVIKKFKGQISYQEFWAVKNVSFHLNQGDRLGILGLNGSGKSTLLKAIAGVYKPTKGSVKKCGLLMPMLELGAGFDMNYTGRENVFLYGAVLGYRRDFMKQHYREIVDFSELNDFMNVPLKNYSSGMRARLGFSIATVIKPDILILDEVLSVGDAKFQKKSEAKILELMENGTSVLFVSHSLNQVKRICNKGMIMEKGKLIAFGDIDKVAQIYQDIIEQ